MEAPAKGVSIPLHRRVSFSIQIILGSMFVGWLWDRPTSLGPILVSCIVGGAGVWFFLASPLIWHLANHRHMWVRGLATIIAVAGLLVFMQIGVPSIHRVIGQSPNPTVERDASEATRPSQ